MGLGGITVVCHDDDPTAASVTRLYRQHSTLRPDRHVKR